MSDSPNSTPPQNNPNRSPGDSNGFNWRVLVLFSVASIILGVAFFGPSMNKAPKNLRYSEFRQVWDQGRVITNDAERPLKVITTDTAYDATITGWVIATNAIRKGASMELVSEALNHHDLKVTQNYFAGFEDEQKKDLARKLTDFEI